MPVPRECLTAIDARQKDKRVIPRWVLFALGAVLIFGVWGVLPKAASPRLSPAGMQLLATCGVVPMASVLLFSRRLRTGAGPAKGMLFAFATGIFGNVGNLALLEALRHGGGASVVYPLTGMFPLVTVVIARAWLKERLASLQMAGVVLSLLAVYLLTTRPAGDTQPPGAPEGVHSASWIGYSLVALLLFGICGVTQKVASVNISTELSAVSWAAGSLPVAGVLFFFYGLEPGISSNDWFLSVLWGALAVLGMIFSFAAYSCGKASVVTALTALYPALTSILAVFIFNEYMDAVTALAIALALAAASALSYERDSKDTAGPGGKSVGF